MVNSWALGWPREFVQIKAPIAANSGTICQLRNADLDDFGRQAACHELISNSLVLILDFFIHLRVLSVRRG